MDKLANFEGRIGRLTFLYFFIAAVVVAALVRLWNPSTFAQDTAMAIGVVATSAWVFACAVVRRFHDLDRSGWNYWRLLIPLYNLYLFGLLLFQEGTIGANRYGEDPIKSSEAREVSPEQPKETPKSEWVSIVLAGIIALGLILAAVIFKNSRG